MPHWGYLLLVIYLALGLSSITWRKAGQIAMLLTLVVVVYSIASYGGLR